MTLEDAWVEAYRANPSLQAERASLRATDEEVSQALSHWRPSIDATSGIGKVYQYVPAQEVFGTADYAGTSRTYGIQVTQPIFRGFRTQAETEAAEKKVFAARAKLQAAEQQLFTDTATAYLDTVRDVDIVNFERENEHVLEQKLVETEARAKAGELTKTDIRQAETRLARAHVSRFQAENTLSSDRTSFRRLVGHAAENLKPPTLVSDDRRNREEILQIASTQNPSVISARYLTDAANSDVDDNKGNLLPEISLVGSSSKSWGQDSTIPGRNDDNQIMLQATFPLYRSGSDYSKVRAAEQTVTQRRMELEETRDKVIETTNNALQALQTSEAAMVADKDEVSAASSALEGVREESKIGTRTTLDVLNAEQELLDAKIDLAKSQHDRDLAILEIRATVGELTADHLKLPVDLYDPQLHYDDVRGQWIGFSESDDRYMVKKPGPETAAE